MNMTDARCILEAALMCASEPLSVRDMRALFDDVLSIDSIKLLLRELQAQWTHRGLELVCLASGWRFQSASHVRPFLQRLQPEKPARYTRAVLETLAIVAYRQPVTRSDIESIRGVAVSAQIIKQLEERGWIEVIGHKETVGHPALFATTSQFLNDLGVSSLQDLPPLDELLPQPLQAQVPVHMPGQDPAQDSAHTPVQTSVQEPAQ